MVVVDAGNSEISVDADVMGMVVVVLGAWDMLSAATWFMVPSSSSTETKHSSALVLQSPTIMVLGVSPSSSSGGCLKPLTFGDELPSTASSNALLVVVVVARNFKALGRTSNGCGEKAEVLVCLLDDGPVMRC